MPDAPQPGEAEPDPLAFTPVAVSGRHNGWTPHRQHDFIRALAAMGNVSRAARAVGKTKQSAYTLRDRPDADSFADAWNTALQMGYDSALEKAIDRACNGITTPRFYKGKQVGTRHRHDYRLAMAALSQPPEPPRNKVAR